MRFLAISILMLLAAAPRPAAAPAREAGAVTIAPEAENAWVPFELTPGNQIRFTLTLDGQPVVAVLDTGVSHSVLARRYADEHKLAVRDGGSAAVIGGSAAVGVTAAHALAFGALVRRGGTLAVADLPAIATGTATPVDLLVGRDLVGAGALDIDFTDKRFRMLPSGRMPFAGAIAPLAVSRDRLIYVTRLTLGRARLSPVIVDTGDGAAVTVAGPGWRAAGLTGLPTTSTIGFGLGGAVVSAIAIAPELRIGALVARHVEVRIEPPRGFSERIGVAGRIGSGFLQNYRVLLDPRAGVMLLSPDPGADKPPIKSTSGLLIGLLPDRLRVLHVMRGGPAEAAGWKAGELICSVDAQPIGPDYATSPLAAWSIGAPGRTVALGLCDGSVRTLTLAAFY